MPLPDRVRLMWGDKELAVITKGRGRLVSLKKYRPSRLYLFASAIFSLCGLATILSGSSIGLAWIVLGAVFLIFHHQQRP